jgi:3',5'-cyclic AMP phosphodiesterase CpdA
VSQIPSSFSRRRFLRQLLGAGAFAATGPSLLPGQTAPTGPATASNFRFAFLTDLHLLENGDLHSAEGIAACLAEVEKLSPRPEFILVGGDLVNRSRDLTIPEAEKRLNQFLKIWHDHTSLPAHWTFGNHDLVGTGNPQDPSDDPHYGKGLFRDRFHLPRLFYSFDHKGWHFVVLDDIALDQNHNYFSALFDEELRFLRADLDAHRASPTIVCTHVPIFSNLALAIHLIRGIGISINAPEHLICTNGSALTDEIPGHNIRAVLAGHLHYYEKLEMSGVPFINSGAVCGNYWKGHVLDCPEGFGVVDLGANGSFNFEYRSYGWQAG